MFAGQRMPLHEGRRQVRGNAGHGDRCPGETARDGGFGFGVDQHAVRCAEELPDQPFIESASFVREHVVTDHDHAGPSIPQAGLHDPVRRNLHRRDMREDYEIEIAQLSCDAQPGVWPVPRQHPTGGHEWWELRCVHRLVAGI